MDFGFLPGYEVVLAAVYLALTQTSDGHGTAKVHMHVAVIFLQHFGSLQQTLQRKSKAGSESQARANQLYSCMNPSDLHKWVSEVRDEVILFANRINKFFPVFLHL